MTTEPPTIERIVSEVSISDGTVYRVTMTRDPDRLFGITPRLEVDLKVTDEDAEFGWLAIHPTDRHVELTMRTDGCAEVEVLPFGGGDREELLDLIEALTAADREVPCRLDHHGYCQEHPGGSLDEEGLRCPYPLAAAVLKNAGRL